MLKITMPLMVMWGKGRTTKFSLNLNQYRNAHFQQTNKAKKTYSDLVKSKLSNLNVVTITGQIKVTYKFFARNRGRVDLGNVCSIHDKFFMDALVEYGLVKDDSFYYVPHVEYVFGGIAPTNPRMEIIIEEIKDMKNELMIEQVERVEIEGSKTVIYLNKGGIVRLVNGASLEETETNNTSNTTVGVKEEPKETKVEPEVKKPTTKKSKKTKKVVEEVEEVAEEVEESEDDSEETEEVEETVETEENEEEADEEVSIQDIFDRAVPSDKPNPFATKKAPETKKVEFDF